MATSWPFSAPPRDGVTACRRGYPASVAARAAVDRIRSELRVFGDEAGRELLDVEDGRFADPEAPAPPRFLPEYDNVALSHADRARVMGTAGPAVPGRRGAAVGSLMVDGFVRAVWSMDEEEGAAVLTVRRFLPQPDDPAGVLDEVVAEGLRLLELLRPGIPGRVRVAPEP